MTGNSDLISKLRDFQERFKLTNDPLGGNTAVSDLFGKAADALELASAEITTLTEFVESVRHIETMKALMRAKVKKLKAINRRGGK